MTIRDHAAGNAIAAFWDGFDSAWHDSGVSSAEEVSDQLLQKANYHVPSSTIRGWLKHERLPRKDDQFFEVCRLLVDRGRTDELMDLLRTARRARAQPAAAPEDPPPAAAPAPAQFDAESGASGVGRRLPRRLTAIVIGAVAVLAGLGVLLFTGAAPPTPNPAPPDGATPAASAVPAPDIAPCPTDTVRAESKKQRASATFCADRQEFLLSDDRLDGKSAVLVVRVNQAEWPAWFNSNRYATRSPDGSQLTQNPPQRIPVSFGATDAADFRVCVADYNVELTYPDTTCGEWTPVWPRP